MKKTTTRQSGANTRIPGFALIVTLVLMVLLMILAVGLLALSSTEIRKSGVSKAQAEARANAKMGMLIALGRLQASLGPDAAATANSSILDTDPTTEEIEGVQHKHWLGVYPTVNPSSPDDSLLAPRDLRDWSLENLEWLVSSSDSTSIPDPTASLSGEGVTLAQYINDPSLAVPDPDQIDSLSATDLTKVQAGLIELEGNEGRFAWWVGDESMKARIDTLASEDGSDILSGSDVDAFAQKQANYVTTQGNNFSRLMPSYADSPENLKKLVTKDSLSLLAENSSDSSWKNWGILNQDKFTTTARTLPVDVVNGSLKKDLTAYFEGTYSGKDGEPMIDPRFSLTADRIPVFDTLKDWAGLVDDPTEPQAVIAPNLTSSTPKAGLYPIITQGAVGLQQCYEILTADAATNNYTVRAVYMIHPQIQIWNPHNVPLAAQDYIVQIGYQFRWWMHAAGRPPVAGWNWGHNTDKITWNGPRPEWHSWETFNGFDPLPVHKPAPNENIQYQANKRFFTFVIKNQAFEPGESLVFYAKPPTDPSGPISGIPYNQNSDADTDILQNYSSDQDLNLLSNEGNLDEFFYITCDTVGTVHPTYAANTPTRLQTESNFQSNTTGSGASGEEDLHMHMNLYSALDDSPELLHASRKPHRNTRTGLWRRDTFPLNKYQDGETFASDTYDYKSPLINFGSSMMGSNFDIFVGGNNINLPPKGGQPHAVLSYWNIRNQESFSVSDSWSGGSLESSTWLNTFSFRDVPQFLITWEAVDNFYGNLSTDRLGGWHQSQVQGMGYPLFDYPTGEYGPLSLGAFQHADLSFYAWQPTYAFGNAQAPPRFDRRLYESDLYPDLYDLSYLLNASTWDQYYLSTIPQSGITLKEGMRLPNSRQVITGTSENTALDAAKLVNSDGFDLSASSVTVHGSFNVNSTSISAWRSFLSGALGQQVETVNTNADSNVATAAAMGRFFRPLVEEKEAATNDRTTTRFDEINGWASTRTLNETELDTLSERIVEEVKRRGPFLSLADFVNRRLEPDSSATGDEEVYQQVLGTIQAAINKATYLDGEINNHFLTETGSNGAKMTVKPAVDWEPPTSGGGIDFQVSDEAKEAIFGAPISEINSQGGMIHTYAPNFLSQADVLTKIGSSITVRGDTFVIRSYGDSLNNSGDIAARAWCEAVVQRIAEPVDWDGTDDMMIQPQAPGEEGFGRQFKVVSFRWLSQDEVMPYSQDDAITQ
ncbi:MAG: hypothetical protein ACSHX9_09910 [Luteolibacter sp.]